MSGFGVVSFAALEEWLDYMGWLVALEVDSDNSLAVMHSCNSSGDRRLETMTPPSLSIVLMIFSRGSEESIVTSEGAMVMNIRGMISSNDSWNRACFKRARHESQDSMSIPGPVFPAGISWTFLLSPMWDSDSALWLYKGFMPHPLPDLPLSAHSIA